MNSNNQQYMYGYTVERRWKEENSIPSIKNKETQDRTSFEIPVMEWGLKNNWIKFPFKLLSLATNSKTSF